MPDEIPVVTAPATVIAPIAAPVERVPSPEPGRQEAKMPSVTTPEEDRTTAGQRDTSMMWEKNQKWISLVVIGVATFVAGMLAILGKILGADTLQLAAAMYLFGAANLVIGFYFGRTNHTRVGGVGARDDRQR